MKFIELFVFLLNRVSEAFVLWDIVGSSILDCLLKSLVLLFNLLLLVSLLLDQGLHLLDFFLKLADLSIVLNCLSFHFFLRLGSNVISITEWFLSHGKIFLDILVHILKLIKVSKLLLFVVDNILLLCVNWLYDLFSLSVQIGIHILNIITLSLVFKEVHIFFFFFFNVDGWTVLCHAAIWIISEAEEITEYVVFGILPSRSLVKHWTSSFCSSLVSQIRESLQVLSGWHSLHSRGCCGSSLSLIKSWRTRFESSLVKSWRCRVWRSSLLIFKADLVLVFGIWASLLRTNGRSIGSYSNWWWCFQNWSSNRGWLVQDRVSDFEMTSNHWLFLIIFTKVTVVLVILRMVK